LKKNLVLTGMMGVGKSTIGRYLSKRLLMEFSDIDTVIEDELKMSVSKIFEKKGELFFRKFEEKITLQETKKKNIVISLGGGAFMNSKIRKNVLLNSESFWLDLNPRLIEKRLTKSKKRPLLNDKNLKTTLDKIYKERKSTYATATHRIECDGLNLNLITAKIIKLYANN
jgi:shikimate kinase|tara:strand:+ start:4 stop:513 length:510 start_codon:yes stop_codon:yes gene_type:complete